jgi:hypothetical protein
LEWLVFGVVLQQIVRLEKMASASTLCFSIGLRTAHSLSSPLSGFLLLFLFLVRNLHLSSMSLYTLYLSSYLSQILESCLILH